MKIKYYIRGCGVGIIVTTIILCIVFSVENNNSNIEKKARDLGMVYPREAMTDIVATTPNKEQNTTETVTESPTTISETETTTEPKTEPKTEPITEQLTAGIDKKGTVSYTIYSGCSSDKVAWDLKDLGLVDDFDKFNDYLVNYDYATRIHVGTYSFEYGMTYEQIAKTIAG